MCRSFILMMFMAGSWCATGQSFEELNNQLLDLYKAGHYDEAIPIAIKAKNAAQKEFGDSSGKYAISLNNLASLYMEESEFTSAEPLLEQALIINRNSSGKESLNYAASLNNLAYLYQRMSKYPAAEPLYKQALDILKKLLGEEHRDYVTSLNNLAGLYQIMNNFGAAELVFKQVITIRKKLFGEESPEYAESISNLASLYGIMGNYNDAKSLYEQALLISRKVFGEEHADYALKLNNLAVLHVKTGNYAVAESFFKQILAITKKLFGEDNAVYITRLNNLAILYVNMGNYTAAEPLYKQALLISRKVFGEEHPEYAIKLNGMAQLYSRMGNYDAAETLYKQALAINKKVLGAEHPDYATNLNNLAVLYANTNNYALAEQLHKQAMAIRKKVFGEDHPDYAESLNNLATLYKNMRHFTEAEPLYRQALAIQKKLLGEEHPDYATSLNNLAALYSDMGNYSASVSFYNQALTIEKKVLGEHHPYYATDLNNLAFLYENMGNYTEAARYFIAGTNLALNHIKNNFSNLSEVEKLKWWENQSSIFFASPSLLVTNPNSSISFLQQTCTQQLQLKGFVLNDGTKVLENARKNGNSQLRRLIDQWQDNKAMLAKQYALPIANRINQLDSLESQTNEQEKQINMQSEIFRAGRENQQIGFNEVRRQLKNDDAAVEFIRFEFYQKRWTDSTFYAALIILPNDTVPHFVSLCEEKQLARLLENQSTSPEQFVNQLYRGIIISNERQPDGKKGDSLYNLIWKPLLPWLEGINKISIAPAGLLNRIAFNALPIDSSHYLIDRYQLRQYNSVRQIAEQKSPASTMGVTVNAILYGGINFDDAYPTPAPVNGAIPNILPNDVRRSIRGGDWVPLPGTLQEVNSIGQLFLNSKINPQVINGTAATEESFKQLSGHSPALLHLATHGFSLPDARQKRDHQLNNGDNQFILADNPLLRSGIIMAGANRVWGGKIPKDGQEDGIVTSYEISNMDLSNTELVVLSACETALGDIKGTEGVFGLQRAFKLAGVQNMILSLWQVPDKETSELMTLFYTKKLTNMPTYEAFRMAQDEMRKKYPPYYWAAFVLIE